MVTYAALTPLPGRCETCSRRPVARVVAGRYLCGRCPRPDCGPMTVSVLDRELTQSLDYNRGVAAHLEASFPDVCKRS